MVLMTRCNPEKAKKSIQEKKEKSADKLFGTR
jgi:hypothetical protein